MSYKVKELFGGSIDNYTFSFRSHYCLLIDVLDYYTIILQHASALELGPSSTL